MGGINNALVEHGLRSCYISVCKVGSGGWAVG